MSGVVDAAGVQWEHCNACAKFIPMKDMGYLKPNKEHEHGLDLCIDCANKLDDEDWFNVVPSRNWDVQYIEETYITE